MFFFFQLDDDNALPSFDQMMKPILVALGDLGGSATLKDLDLKTMEIMNLPDDLILLPHKGASKRTEVEYRLAWARTYLKKYGLIENTSRGIWALSKNYDGNYDRINTEEVLRVVREKSQSKSILTNIESALAFENLVLGIIIELMQQQNRTYHIAYSDSFDTGYDLILPDGIDEVTDTVYCNIKYLNPQNKNVVGLLTDAMFKIHKSIGNGYLLLICNLLLKDDIKSEITDYAKKAGWVNFIIWDSSDLSDRMDPDSDYTKYFIAPKQSIVEDTLKADPTDDEKQKIKKSHIDGLKRAYKNQDVVLFLGAGVSIEAGIPLWSDLIKKLLIHMIESTENMKELSKEEMEMLNELAFNNRDGSPLTQIRYIKSALSDEKYYKLVHKVLYSQPLKSETKLLDSIAKISAPQRSYNGIKSIVTYNFDDLIERKLAEKEVLFNTIYQEDDMAAFDKLNVYHVHGYLPKDWDGFNSTSLIFSEEDYHKVYRDSFSWSNLTQINSFRDNTCLFIGCSLTDPNLRRLLDIAARNKEAPRHYAILRKSKSAEKNRTVKEKELLALYERIDHNIRDGYFRDLGINVIWIDEYDEIPNLLLNLI